MVERSQLSIKRRLWRYFTHTRSTRYIHVLNKIVDSYNNTYHSTLKTTPNSVTEENEVEIWHRIYGGKMLSSQNYKYNVGDLVRVTSQKRPFLKSYDQGNWSEEVFKVSARVPRNPPVYRLVDLNGQSIKGTWYAQELQKVRVHDDLFIVDKVLRRRRRNNKTQYLVRWLDYSDKFDSWVDELQ